MRSRISSPTARNATSAIMPMRAEPVISVMVATEAGARKRGRASRQGVEAEIAARLVDADAARQIGARRGLYRAEGEADQQAEEDIGLFRRGAEKAAAVGGRQRQQAEQREAGAGRDDAERRDHQADEADDDDHLRAEPGVKPAGIEAAADRHDIENDAVDAEFDRLPAKHAGCKGAAKSQQAVDAVLKDHPGDQEAQDARSFAEVPRACAAVRQVRRARPCRRHGHAFGLSGVNRNIGRMKTRYQIAEIGPVTRASSPVAGSSPNSG